MKILKKKKDKKFIAKLEKQNYKNVLNKVYFTLMGDFEGYNYDIYANSEVVGNVLPHESDGYFKLRINEGGNVVRLMMMCLAVDRMTFEDKNERKRKRKLFKRFNKN